MKFVKFLTRLPAVLSLGMVMATPAQSGDLSGRVELTYQQTTAPADSFIAALGHGDYGAFQGNARLIWARRWDSWSAQFHYKITAQTGSDAALSRSLSAFSTGTNLRTFYDLSANLSDTDELVASHTIDRLSLAYSAPNFVARIGRQTLTWGAGTVFHPMDLVAPFSPDATDTEFKPGVDMLYLQWLMQDGSDLEIITVPRRETIGGPATAAASTIALRYQTSIGDLGANVILAHDHGDLTAGLGLSGSLGGAIWNTEIVPTRLENGTVLTSGLANISFATQVFDNTTLLFAEYFHNGFGSTGTQALDALPNHLSERLALGQVFTTSQDYLAMGMNMELTPLLGLGASAILNLNDQSFLASAELNWSLGDNSNLKLGLQIPGGARGSEFGGLALSGSAAPYATPQTAAYVRFQQYF